MTAPAPQQAPLQRNASPAAAPAGPASSSAEARTIPIQGHLAQAAPAHAGCGHCPHDENGLPVCSARRDAPTTAPQLSGPADELLRLTAALGRPFGFGAPATLAGVVRALRLQPGEVELQLAVGRHCGGAELADAAFQTLRALLPDTDIYVTLAG